MVIDIQTRHITPSKQQKLKEYRQSFFFFSYLPNDKRGRACGGDTSTGGPPFASNSQKSASAGS